MQKLELIKNDTQKNEQGKKANTPEPNNIMATKTNPPPSSNSINLEEDDILIILIAFLLIQDKRIDPILVIVLALLLLDIDITQIFK